MADTHCGLQEEITHLGLEISFFIQLTLPIRRVQAEQGPGEMKTQKRQLAGPTGLIAQGEASV